MADTGAQKLSKVSASANPSSLVGVSLKNQHFKHILENRPRMDFFEVHAENFMSDGGNHLLFLDEVREHYALSLHGVGMSLGSAEGLSSEHLQAFRRTVDRYKPFMVSEHLAWSVHRGTYLNDLLPVPLTQESFHIVADNIMRMQDGVGQQVLIENPSSYLAFSHDEMQEHTFLNDLSSKTGCGLLLDINNVFVSAANMGWSAEAYLAEINVDAIGEIHLAGHTLRDVGGATVRIDDHGSSVSDDVWALYASFIQRRGAFPTLIEWDTNVPAFEVLTEEAGKAQSLIDSCLPAASVAV